MARIEGLTINEAQFDLPNDRTGKLAVFIYLGKADPSKVLDYAVHLYVGNTPYNELIDANMDNPWMRVIISNINDMRQAPFDSDIHKLSNR